MKPKRQLTHSLHWLMYTVILSLICPATSVLIAQSDTTRIMLLGDSITGGIMGSDPVGGFRDDLDSMLTEAGAEFNFVGTLNDGVGFDADHEGHGGYTVDMILADIDSFLVQVDPQVVLVHLGTNDIAAMQGVSSTLSELDSLLTVIYNYRPSMFVFLSGIIPRSDSLDSLHTQLNQGILNLVIVWGTLGYSIKYVDHNTAFKNDPNWLTDYMYDTLHPNNAGYAVMARSYFDSIATEGFFDIIPPGRITDLAVSGAGSHTVLLHWTATGDDDSVGVADHYDVRYSTSMITESNFPNATQAVGEPRPLASGSTEEFTVGGLGIGMTYYFAVKAIDEGANASPMSNVVAATTVETPVLVDDFERLTLGPDWNADSTFIVNNGELSNESLEENWNFMAVYLPATNPEEIKLRWGTNADTAGINEGGLALMLDSPSPDANGYLIFRHYNLNSYQLFTIVGGAPGPQVGSSPVSTLPYPGPGDEFSVVVSTDANGHHFDCYINGEFDTRVSDPTEAQGNADTLWAGVMLHGNRNNNVDDFWESGPNANVAPGSFSLLSPADGATVDTGTPLLDWEDSIDPNLSDSVLYTLYYGTSPVFAPESTTVVGDLSASEYAIPPMGILSLVRDNHGHPSRIEALPRGAGRVRAGEGVLPVVMDDVGVRVDPSPSSLPDDVVIYWKVKAVDTGSLETWSQQQDWSFTVSIPDPPLPFSLLSPADGDTVTTTTPTLTWEASSDPDPGDVVRYEIYYDTDPQFLSSHIIGGIEDTSFTTLPLEDSTTYYWKVEAVDSTDLITESSETFHFLVLTPSGIGDNAGSRPVLPKVFALGQNYPNPFNPSTSIRYDVPAGVSSQGGVDVLLQVYSVRGRLIRTLEDGTKAPGRYVVQWDGRDDGGRQVGSGIYIYRIQAGSFAATKKMVVLK